MPTDLAFALAGVRLGPCGRAPSAKPMRRRFARGTKVAVSPKSAPDRDVDPIAQSGLGTPKVISVGEALLDCVVDSETGEQLQSRPGGAPANVATALAKLGTASAFVGVVGQDEAGTQLTETFREAKVNCDGLVSSPEAPTRRVLVERDAATGERTFLGFGGEDESLLFADMMLKPDDFPGILFYASQFLVTGTLALGLTGGSVANAVREAVEVAQMCKLQVLVDVNWRPIFWGNHTELEAREIVFNFIKSTANWVKLSDEDALWLFPDLKNPTAEAIFDEFGSHKLQGVLLTLGAEGVQYCIEGNRGDVQPKLTDSMRPVDTTGGGDAFVAGFLSETILRGGPGALLDADVCCAVVEFAVACGAITVCGEGAIAAQPTRGEVENFLGKVGIL